MPDSRTLNADTVTKLVQHFQVLYEEHMRDLPIVNKRIDVEGFGFREFGAHQLGALITPWFMNLVLLPSDDEWRGSAQGETSTIEFPSGPVEFTVSRDDELGTYLTAVLRQSVADLPDPPTARKVAEQGVRELFLPPRQERRLSRRELLTGLRGR
jgi:[NiFe] hydrogenase assembly HybE family chaperone